MKPSWAVTKLMLACGSATGVSVEVGAAGEAVAEVATGTAAPLRQKSRTVVAVASVPLRPVDGEVAHLVATLADVPRLGDELDAAR